MAAAIRLPGGPGRRAVIGRGERYRSGSWLERTVDRMRRGRTTPAPLALKRIHEAVLDRLPGDHLVSTLPGGERVRLTAKYRYLSWNPEEYAAFRTAVTPRSTVLDVGANVGAYTILFALWAHAGHVVAFEPSPDARAGLRRHIDLNGVAPRVCVEPFAVCAVTGTASFRADAFSGANALVPEVPGSRATITVRTTSLDEYCEARGTHPDVVKIDVEGAELDVLRGARRTLAQPGLTAFVEFHPTTWAATGVAPDAIRAELAVQRLSAEPLRRDFDVWTTEGVCARLVHT